ncbi:MAG: right-handed parallel beta-helix repeat-containing protein, partial [Chloroflexi bacterium]|nr:right-handed parallel beta-helix repeat-containing protein [Chloroflexota bacterium]
RMTDIIVALTGDDTTGNGTVGTPYRTVKKALQVATTADEVRVRDIPNGGTTKYSEETLDSSCAGTITNPKIVRPYAGEQPTFVGRFTFGNSTSRANYIHFIGDRDIRFDATADTIIFENANNNQHALEMYSVGNIIEGCIVDKLDSYLGSCVAMGWNGGTGQYRCVDSKVWYCLIRNVGRDPSYTSTSAGHDHGFYLNYNLNCEVSYNVIREIAGGWGIHLYTESASARDVDGTSVHHNTTHNTRDGGIILSGAGTSTTKNTTVDDNLIVNAGQVGQVAPANYSFMVYWGGGAPVGTGNTGARNHSHNPKSGHVQPSMTGWTLATPATGDPLFVNTATGDFRLQDASPAIGKGALGTTGEPAPPATYPAAISGDFEGATWVRSTTFGKGSTTEIDKHAAEHRRIARDFLAIEGELGASPKGGLANVASRLAALEAQIVAASGTTVGFGPRPSDHGLKAWSYPPGDLGSSTSMAFTSQREDLCRAKIPASPGALSTIWWHHRVAAATTAGAIRFTLRDKNGVLIAKTADLVAGAAVPTVIGLQSATLVAEAGHTLDELVGGPDEFCLLGVWVSTVGNFVVGRKAFSESGSTTNANQTIGTRVPNFALRGSADTGGPPASVSVGVSGSSGIGLQNQQMWLAVS